jgi:two-component system sensor histidine kinase MprB
MTDTVSATGRATMTLRTRIALLVAIAVGLAIAITAAAVYFVVRSELYGQFDEDLLSRAQAVGQALADPEELTRVPVELLANAQVGLLTSDNVVWPAQGGAVPPTSATELAIATSQQGSSVRGATVEGQSLRVAAVPVGNGNALILAEPTDSVDKTLRDLGLLFLLIGIVGVAGAAAAGYTVARAGLGPVEELTEAAERVARTEELTPIDVHSDDEVGRLAASFNAMLAALDASRERERRLVADAGHELRTPLTSIRTNLDLLAQANDAGVELPPTERGALLSDVRAQIAELGDLILDLVQLSRGAPAADLAEEFDLAPVVQRSVERVRRRASGVRFDVDVQPWWLVGDSSSLERAVTNLLDNAAKWSPKDGTVTVRLSEGTLAVADSGPGIPQSDRERVFERFYRSPDARGRPGSGLGLAIVAQTAEQHGGGVAAGASATGGALLTLTVPGSSQPPATG